MCHADSRAGDELVTTETLAQR
eukprot:SAG11_NODE_20638_length_441_cov_0.909357_1_plen_21_part_10